MGATVKALIAIYTALGGSASTANIKTIPEALNLIASYITTSGLCGLPDVSATDNGDILRVVNGAWAKADAELPAVSATDNGSVLKVVEGVWAVGDDATE